MSLRRCVVAMQEDFLLIRSRKWSFDKADPVEYDTYLFHARVGEEGIWRIGRHGRDGYTAVAHLASRAARLRTDDQQARLDVALLGSLLAYFASPSVYFRMPAPPDRSPGSLIHIPIWGVTRAPSLHPTPTRKEKEKQCPIRRIYAIVRTV